MTNQSIVDDVEEALPRGLEADIKERILDAVYSVLNDHRGEDEDHDDE